MLHTTIRRSLAIALLVGSGLTACSSDSPKATTATTVATAPTSTAATASAGVTIVNFKFTIPASVTAGTPFSVTNNGESTHTFSDTGGKFSVKLEPGTTQSLTVPAGTYQVVCQIHSSMTGTLVVK